MGKIYFFYETTARRFSNFSSCTVYDPELDDWFELASMKTARSEASCTVFQGQCVVAGGHADGIRILKSVESYDHHLDEWSFLPSSMRVERIGSGLLSKGNKMFVIGGDRPSCESKHEVYDCLTKKFTFIASSPSFHHFNKHLFTTGHKIFVFDTLCNDDPLHGYVDIPTYDTVKNKWFKTSKRLLTEERLWNFSIVVL